MYVTLAKDDEIISSKIVENQDNKYHSAFLVSTVKSILKDSALTPKDINGIGTNVGPGSFTGIRACTTVARIMAQQLNIPAVGISSLEILKEIAPAGKKPAVALDARKGCAYFYIDGQIKGAVDIENVKKMLHDNNYYVITDNKLSSLLGGISYQQNNYPLGDILAKLSYKKLQTGKCDWKDVKPLYIQPPPGV